MLPSAPHFTVCLLSHLVIQPGSQLVSLSMLTTSPSLNASVGISVGSGGDGGDGGADVGSALKQFC